MYYHNRCVHCVGNNFTQPMGFNVLPPSLKKLFFGTQFNQSLGKVKLPRSLERLHFHQNYNQRIAVDALPQSLRWLYLPDALVNSLSKEALPKSLTILPSVQGRSRFLLCNIMWYMSVEVLCQRKWGVKYKRLGGVDVSVLIVLSQFSITQYEILNVIILKNKNNNSK